MNRRPLSSIPIRSAVIASLLALHPFPMAAQQPLSRAPLNPAFVEYQAAHAVGMVQAQSTSGHPLGYVPAPMNLAHTAGQGALVLHTALTTPASYDLRTLGKLTAIRDQADCGDCWAFGAMASVESCLLTNETWDFSENNLKNNAGFDYGPCDGGSAYMSTAYFTRWSGPATEAADPYHDWDDRPSPAVSAVKHVQDVLFLPLRASATDNDTIKQAIMTYGAVTSSFYYDDAYYNSSTSAYYCNEPYYSNHEVAIVGWDDNYPASNFASAPAGNGAFIMKNSWGTSWGQAGYFYISYYDTGIGMNENAVFDSASSTDNYTRIYQYDPLGWVTGLGYGETSAWAANVFTANELEQLQAVSLYTPTVNTSYSLSIYCNPTSPPIGGAPLSTQSGTIAYPGYHTLALTAPVMLSAGQKFSVVIYLSTPGYYYPIPIEYAYSGYSSAATAAPGQSYLSYDGSYWEDATTWDPTCNVCIKALTSAFHVTSVARASKDVCVTWRMATGSANVLEATPGASRAYTTNFTTLFVATNTVGTTTNYLDSGAATNASRFYRVRVVAP